MKKNKRLVVDLSEKDHKRIKRMALDKSSTIKNLVIEALALYIKAHEEKP